ncbi:hypothetical protein D3C81_554460 [compost metagenome]
MEGLMGLLRFALHLLAALGIWMLVRQLAGQGIREAVDRFHYRLSLKKSASRNRYGRNGRQMRVPFYNHLDRLLYMAKRNYDPGTAVYGFLTQSAVLTLAVFICGALTFHELPGHLVFRNPFMEGVTFDENGPDGEWWKMPLFLAALAGSVPYLRLRYVSAHNKVSGSYHLLDVVKIAAKFTHLPVDALLSNTADALEADNVLASPLRVLSSAFAGYSTEMELLDETRRFSAAVGTTFAVEFVSDLLYSEKEGGFYLKNSLLTLTRSMERQREAILAVKANSRDAISLGLYGNLIVLFFSLGTFIYMLKPAVYFHLQFETKPGLAFMMVILAGLFLSFVIGSALSRPKLDYH